MILGRSGQLRLYTLLATIIICSGFGVYDLYIENDLFAACSFILAGVAFYLYIKAKRFIESEKTWRSYN